MSRLLTRFLFAFTFTATGFAETYEVGPGKRHAHPLTVPWDELAAGDTVLIHYSPSPYRVKWNLAVVGTAESPVVVRGVRGPEGQRPMIEGEDALTPPRLVYNGEVRSLLKIGASSIPADVMPAHIIVEGLDFHGARHATRFYSRRGEAAYVQNAAGLFLEKGEHITIRDCRFSGCSNGIFVAPHSAHIRIVDCEIEDNGNAGSFYEHNVYSSSVDIQYIGCRLGPLTDGSPGNNLKDRSAGLIVRNCWIEGGNRQLDLVDAQNADWIAEDETYDDTWVVGNVLLEFEPRNNNQIIHFGGDSGDKTFYRTGTLHLWHNTIISKRPKATVLRLSTSDATADLRGNIIYTINGGAQLAMLDDLGRVKMETNWIRRGWKKSFASGAGIFDVSNSLEDTSPEFVHVASNDYRLADDSPCVDIGDVATELPWQVEEALERQFRWPSGTTPRIDPGKRNLGAIGVEPVRPQAP